MHRSAVRRAFRMTHAIRYEPRAKCLFARALAKLDMEALMTWDVGLWTQRLCPWYWWLSGERHSISLAIGDAVAVGSAVGSSSDGDH